MWVYMESPDAYLEKATIYQEDGFLDDALRELKRALRAATDKAPVYKRLAAVYHGMRRMDDAISALKKAIKLHTGDVEARESLLDMLIELGEYDAAIHEGRTLLKVYPRSLSAREVLSIAYLQKGLLDESMRITNELISLDPTSVANHFKRAWLFQQKGDYGNAINEYLRVLDMQPDEGMAQDAQQAIDAMDSFQLRQIITLALEDYIFRAKLVRNPETAALERGFIMSYTGLASLKQIKFDELPEIYSEWKQRYYH